MGHFYIYLSLFFTLICTQQAYGGSGDTRSQLEAAYGNIDMNNPLDKVSVEVIYGNVPAAIEGTFIRHGCGAFGHVTKAENPDESTPVDRITHIFDCIEIAQAFHFSDGETSFSSKFYDTIKNDIYK